MTQTQKKSGRTKITPEIFKEVSSSNHPFSGAKMLVSGRKDPIGELGGDPKINQEMLQDLPLKKMTDFFTTKKTDLRTGQNCTGHSKDRRDGMKNLRHGHGFSSIK